MHQSTLWSEWIIVQDRVSRCKFDTLPQVPSPFLYPMSTTGQCITVTDSSSCSQSLLVSHRPHVTMGWSFSYYHRNIMRPPWCVLSDPVTIPACTHSLCRGASKGQNMKHGDVERREIARQYHATAKQRPLYLYFSPYIWISTLHCTVVLHSPLVMNWILTHPVH